MDEGAYLWSVNISLILIVALFPTFSWMPYIKQAYPEGRASWNMVYSQVVQPSFYSVTRYKMNSNERSTMTATGIAPCLAASERASQPGKQRGAWRDVALTLTTRIYLTAGASIIAYSAPSWCGLMLMYALDYWIICYLRLVPYLNRASAALARRSLSTFILISGVIPARLPSPPILPPSFCAPPEED